jgi:hypothetical protein
MEPSKILVSTFWSSLSGLPDIPENYKTIQYILSTAGGKPSLTFTQVNNKSLDEKDHSAKNWKMVLGRIKKILES